AGAGAAEPRPRTPQARGRRRTPGPARPRGEPGQSVRRPLEHGPEMVREDPLPVQQRGQGSDSLQGGHRPPARGDAMVEELLVEADLQNGRRLVEALDAADFPVVAALWYY